MKKVLLVLLVVLGLTSCDMRIKDNEGWLIWNFSDMDNDCVLVQSHQGFMVVEEDGNSVFYNEEILNCPNEIFNVLNQAIDVKITYQQVDDYWITIEPNSSLVLENKEE